MPEPWAGRATAQSAEPVAFQEPFEVLSSEPRTPTIRELWLRPLAQPLEFLPGEYVLLEDTDGRVPPRSYSIANAPRPDALISLLVTCVPGGSTSPWVHTTLRPGDQVSISGPYGTFVDDPASTAPALFLAAGSGLAPIRALLEAATADGRRPQLRLIVSVRTEADVIDGDRFTAWEGRDPRFRYVRTLTREDGAPPRGRIPELLPALGEQLTGHDVFIAGAPGFVAACAAAADGLGAARASIRTEVFFVEPQPWSGVPPGSRSET